MSSGQLNSDGPDGQESSQGSRAHYHDAEEDSDASYHDQNDIEAANEDEDAYRPDYDEEEDEDDDDENEEEDEDFEDAEDGELQVQLVVEAEGDDANGAAQGGATAGVISRTLRLFAGNRPGLLTQRQLLALIGRHDLSDILLGNDEEGGILPRRRRRPPPHPNRFPNVPSEEGRKLMESGMFGSTDQSPSAQKHVARRILNRELGLGDRASQRRNQNLMAQELIPSTNPDMIINYDDPVCCGQFSDDGNFFYACVKDFRVRMYDTSNPYNWRHYKTVLYPFGQWTLTDADLSPDNKWLAYTSLQSSVCLAPTDPNDTGDPYTLDLASSGRRQNLNGWHSHGSFAIYSIRFSGDGRELVAGTRADSIVVYDIESRTVLHHIRGHDNDVNAVCFADKSSSHILYSGSDDTTIKVWDRRSMGDGREAGAFVGHIEGLTYIDTKGDGRYILSNGKDQSTKLWDLRMAMSTSRFHETDPTQHTRHSDYDYRWEVYNDDNWFVHKHDNSVVTFRGHKIHHTLLRCHFSPPVSTNSRYVYSASADGCVYVWNLDATLAAKIDVNAATQNVPLPQIRGYNFRSRENSPWNTLVRDVGWHPNAPLLVASAWNGPNMHFGTASLHSFNEAADDEALPKMGMSVNDRLGEFMPAH